MRVNFDLQRAEFVQDESDDEIRMPYRDLIRMYNKQYSLVMAETKKFYTECKNAISNTLSLNQLGMGFNVPYLLQKFLVLENSINSSKVSERQQHWKKVRDKYQLQFHGILSRMGKVIEDLLQFQIDIKLAYLGQQVKSSTKQIKLKKQINEGFSTPKMKYLDDTNYVSNKYETQFKKVEKNQEQSVLRGILKRNMSPQKLKKQKVCQKGEKPLKNLDYLLEKTERLCKQMKNEIGKQEQIWNIFNEKRPSRLTGQTQLQKWNINGSIQKQTEIFENEGNDSQYNLKLYETFQTSFN